MERGLLVGGVARARRQPSASSDNAARFTPFRLPTKRGAARGRHVSAAAAQLQRGSLLGATERPAQRKRSPWRERPQRRERPPSAAVVGPVLRLCGSAARSSARALHELASDSCLRDSRGFWNIGKSLSLKNSLDWPYEKLFLRYRANPRRNVYVGNAPLVAWESFVIRKTRCGPRGTVPRGNPEVLRITNDVQATNE